jgi:hypothetical protein
MGNVKRIDVIDLQTFLSKKKEPVFIIVDLPNSGKDIQKHLKANRKLYSVAALSLVMVGIPDIAFASTGIDKGGMRIYKKLVNVGKWVIIVKGGIDIITSITNGDIDSAKKRFIGYLMAYGTLWALPWGMDQVEQLFEDETTFKTE